VRHLLGHHVGLLGHAWLLGHHLVGTWSHLTSHLRLHGSLVVVEVALGSWLVLGEGSSLTLHESLALVRLGRLLSLDELEELLDDVGEVGLGHEVVPVVVSGDRLVLVPISLISELFLLEISNFLDLVVVDDQTLAIVGLASKGVLGDGAGIRLLEADEGIGVVLESLLKSDLLDLSVVGEEVGQFGLSPGGGEVLDVQVASLLGCLVSNSLDLLLTLAVSLVEEVTQVHLQTVTHVFAGEGIDCLGTSLRAVVFVLTVSILVADESVLADVVLEQNQGLDVTERLEECLNLGFSHISGDILEVQVVHNLLLDFTCVLGSVSEHFACSLKCSEAFLGALLILEADEGEASGGEVFIEGDLAGLDGSELGELLMQVLVSQLVLVDFLGELDEDVVVLDLSLSLTSEVFVEGEGSGLASIKDWISHLLLGEFEHLGVLDVDDCGVEGLNQVTVDLGLLVTNVDTFGFEHFSDLDGGDLVLGQIVEVHVVSLIVGCHCYFLFLFFF